MPNFGKRRFRYLEEDYLNKWINIAAINRAKTGAFSAVMGHKFNVLLGNFSKKKLCWNWNFATAAQKV